MTVSQLKQSMTVWEYQLWAQFYKRERQEIKKLHEKMGKKK